MDTKPCPKCGANMVIVVSSSIPLSGLQFSSLWWCNCGHSEWRPPVELAYDYRVCVKKWNKANAKTEQTQE